MKDIDDNSCFSYDKNRYNTNNGKSELISTPPRDNEFSINQLDSIGITNQRETTLAWRKSTGEPLHNALVWQDTRTQDICNEIKQIL